MSNYAETSGQMNDAGQFPVVQIGFLEKIGDAAVANQYGVHASPDQGSAALVIYINGDPTNRVIIPLSSLNRNKGLEEGEVELGNFKAKSYIKFDKDGNIDLQCEQNTSLTVKGNITLNISGNAVVNASKATINNDTEINGNLVVNGNITSTGIVAAASVAASGAVGGGTVVAGGKDLETHTHPPGTFTAGGDAVTGESGAPS